MKRPTPRRLEPETARKKIVQAKSNKPFMAALLDRDHRGHSDAVDQWSRLHSAAFPEPSQPASTMRHSVGGSNANGEFVRAARAGNRERRTEFAGEEPQVERRTSGSAAENAIRRKSANPTRPSNRRAENLSADRDQIPDEILDPDPDHPRDIDRSAIAPLLRRSDEGESDWIRRLAIAASDPDISVERLVVIREAILREIGFYDVGAGPAGTGRQMSESDWNVLAALQNIPVDAWRSALSLGEQTRAEFEKTGILPFFGVLGPDGNIYHRLSIKEEHPVGGVLRAIDEVIRIKQPASPEFDAATVLPALALGLAARRGGMSPRSPLLSTTATRVFDVIRSRRGLAVAGLATGIGLGLTGEVARERRAGAEMDAAPDLPPVPGLEPPERPETERESLPADLPPIPPLPGFMPEDYANLVEIFPDQRGELPIIDILDRWGSLDTQRFNTETMRRVRDMAEAIGIELKHLGGGRPDEDSRYEPELYLRPPGRGRAGGSYLDIAFQSKRTDRKLLINTIDTRADNVTPTGREDRAAVRILENSETGDILVLLAKPPRGQTYDLDGFLEWIRPLVEEIDRDLPDRSGGHQRRFDFR